MSYIIFIIIFITLIENQFIFVLEYTETQCLISVCIYNLVFNVVLNIVLANFFISIINCIECKNVRRYENGSRFLGNFYI